jgi:hypothetical protein
MKNYTEIVFDTAENKVWNTVRQNIGRKVRDNVGYTVRIPVSINIFWANTVCDIVYYKLFQYNDLEQYKDNL